MVQIANLAAGKYWEHMGMSVVEDTDGKLRVVMKAADNLKQVYGSVHGGAIAGLLDASIAVAVNRQLDENEGAFTVEMKINYLRTAKEGTLWGEGKVIKKGNKIVVAQGEIRDDSGELIAFGTATFMVVRAGATG